MNNAPKVQEQTITQILTTPGHQECTTGHGSAELDLARAIGKMASLKEEHRPIMEQIAKDPGMSPETRLILVDHVLEEEEELVTQISALMGHRAASGGVTETGVDPSRGSRQGLTVGSMRSAYADANQGGSVGSLKMENIDGR